MIALCRANRDIGDHGVERIGGIDFAKKPTGQLFLSPGSPERGSFEGGRLDDRNADARDARTRRRGDLSQSREAYA
jgi:hypothetical protein